jgi:hypothetical protein
LRGGARFLGGFQDCLALGNSLFSFTCPAHGNVIFVCYFSVLAIENYYLSSFIFLFDAFNAKIAKL